MNHTFTTLQHSLPLLVLALLGCGGGGVGTQAVVEFPGREALAAIGAKPAGKLKLPQSAGPAGSWMVEQVLPMSTEDEPWQPEGPWEKAFAEVAASAPHPPRLTRALSCAAKELGLFYLKNGSMPDESLHRFMLGACGNFSTQITVSSYPAEVPAGATDEKVYAELGNGLRPRLEEIMRRGPQLAGFWFGREKGRVVALTAFGTPKAQIKPFSLIPNEQDEIVIEGRMHEPVQYLVGYINQGRSGVASCDMDVSVPRPSFRATCKLAAQDPTAWIELFYTPPRRVLTEPFAQVLVRHSAEEVPVYQPSNYAESRSVGSAEEFARVALEQLNLARKEAGLRPVALAAQQSATAARLAPHYFAAAAGEEDPSKADTIALGLLAGWEVGGMIRGASFISSLSPHSLDAGRWLTAALEMPLGRMALFAPEIEQVAFGPLWMRGPDALGALVAGYQFHHGNDHGDDVKMLLTRVIRARRRLGLQEPKRLGTMAEVMDEELALVHENKATPMEALDAVLQRGVGRFHAPMRGLVLEASSLDELELPPQIVRQSTLHLDIGVTHHKAPGAAWAQFTILVIYVDFTGSEA